MANSGYFRGSGTIQDSHAFLNWRILEQDISENRSRISWEFFASFNNADTQLDNGIVKQNGTQIWANSGRIKNFEGRFTSRNIAISSGEFWLPHESDGTKRLNFEIGLDFYRSGRSSAISQTWDLPQIPRNSTVRFDKNSYILGEKITAIINRKSNFTHNGTLQIPDNQEIVAFSNVAEKFEWTPTESEKAEIYRRITTSKKAVLGADILTFSGGRQIGERAWFNAEIQLDEENIRPEFRNFTFSDRNQTVAGILGNGGFLVKGFSKLQVQIRENHKATARFHAEMQKYRLEFDGRAEEQNFSQSAVNFSLVTPNSAGNHRIIIRAIDSRGISKSVFKTVNVLDYSPPVIFAEAKRRNNFDENTTLKIRGNFSELLVNGTAKNRINNLKFRFRNVGGNFGNWQNLRYSQNGGNFTANDEFISLNRNEAFEIEILASDRLSSNSVIVRVESGKPILFISDNLEKIGVGKVPQNGDLDVAGEIYSGGKRVLVEGGNSAEKFAKTKRLGSNSSKNKGKHILLRFSSQDGLIRGKKYLLLGHLEINALGKGVEYALILSNSSGTWADIYQNEPNGVWLSNSSLSTVAEYTGRDFTLEFQHNSNNAVNAQGRTTFTVTEI